MTHLLHANTISRLWHVIHNTQGSQTSHYGPTVGARGNIVSRGPVTTPRSYKGFRKTGRKGFPNLFAVTIGINNYSHVNYQNLRGCVSDADAVETYLREELAVPSTHITSLRDFAATRQAIIATIKGLGQDRRINEGDPILIYYAGHGGEADAPAGWPSENSTIQLLIPHDCGTTNDGTIVHGIPDSTLGSLLKEIADAKGDNITVILDNCYSGSGTRELPQHETPTSIRKIHYEYPIPPSLDRQIQSPSTVSRNYSSPPQYGNPRRPTEHTRAIHSTPDLRYGGLKSHVLLAACRAGELARETDGRGAFTKALLATLTGLAIEKLTYSRLLQLMPSLPKQHPQCEGNHHGRILFNGLAPRRCHITHTCSLGPNYTITIDAGLAHGITEGSKFSVWVDDKSHYNEDEPVATIIVNDVHPFTSTGLVSHSSDLIHQWGSTKLVAEHIESGTGRPDLVLHIPNLPCMKPVFEAVSRILKKPNLRHMNIVLSDPENAQIRVIQEANGFYLEVNDPEVNQYGLKRIPRTIPTTADAVDFHRIIYFLANYEYHFHRADIRRSVSSVPPFSNFVFLEFYKVRKFTRINDRLLEDSENLNRDGTGINIVNDGSWYIVRLCNKSEFNFYPALFYFDNCDLSITSLYQPPSTQRRGRIDPPLKAFSSLTIGHASSGCVPFMFEVRGTQPMEVGFLKLFISTDYIEYADVEQASPFQCSRAMTRFQAKPVKSWDTIVVPLTIRRLGR